MGRGQFVQRSEIPFGTNDEAGAITLTLSGVDAAIVSAVRCGDIGILQSAADDLGAVLR